MMGAEYVKALLAPDGMANYRDLNEDGNNDDTLDNYQQCCHCHVTTLSKCFLLFDIILTTMFLLICWPISLPFWPFLATIFVLAFYAIANEHPAMLKPLLMLIIFSLSICPTILMSLVVIPFMTPDLMGAMMESFFPSYDPLGHSLLTILTISTLFLIPFLYWQLRTFWHCQEYFRLIIEEREMAKKGYSELGITEPFLNCQMPAPRVIEKQPMNAENKCKKNNPIDQNVKVSLNILPDYQVFTLQEEEKMEEGK